MSERTFAARLRRWPEAFQRSHFADLEEHERDVVAALVVLLDARPEFAQLVEEPPAPAPEKLFDEASGDAQRERPEPTYPEWSKSKPGQPRELPDVALAFMREHGLRS